MSYILEALKKAQAERQLGELPTIHVAPLHGAADDHPVAGRRLPWLGILGGVVILLLVLLVVLLWRGQAPAVADAPAPVVAPPVVATVPAPVAPPTPPTPVPVVAAAPTPAPPRQVAPPAPMPQPKPSAPPPAPKPVPLSKPVTVSKPVPVAPASAPAPAPADSGVGALHDLPEPIQRQIPPVTIGGSMYSADPANRLLLIDRELRHEGEEIAPGLVLEKLLPKAAIFNYRGYRYRQPY